MLTAYTQYVELYIDQVSRLVASDTSLLSVSTPGIESAFLPGYERIGSLWRSVESVKTWLDVFYRIPVAKCMGLPFHFWSQLIRCTTILKYLSTLEDPAWDCHAVRQKVDIMAVLEWMSNKLNLISEEAGLQSNDDLFKLLSKLLHGSREWVETRFKAATATTATTAASQPPANEAMLDIHTTSLETDMPDLDHIPWLQSMDLDNDKWFEEVLGWSPCAL
ncbi:hypothetical protein PISL3812_07401 [Talaromyces islandicus]|uniref:C6 transcription factor n=1 Tax=Talaromyces islandicus TaxID=28573 RepID=A0A0U1M465_TALIS|nr:hypothetical protein PISL3812_07401 [Talaromyces islandicus]